MMLVLPVIGLSYNSFTMILVVILFFWMSLEATKRKLIIFCLDVSLPPTRPLNKQMSKKDK